MTEDDTLSSEERQALIARFGEYRHIPLARYGPFRVDTQWFRSPTTPEQTTVPYQIVFELDAAYEFDLLGDSYLLYRMFGPTAHGWPVPTRAELLRIATDWWERFRPTPEGGMQSLACYRRRVGPMRDLHELAAGVWYIGSRCRRPGNPMISMAEAAPLVDAALRALAQAEAETKGLSSE